MVKPCVLKPRVTQRSSGVVVRIFLLVFILLFGGLVQAESSKADTIAYVHLPPQAHDTLVLIKQGGPFPYPRKDGSVFSNREKRLPLKARGYYREYTVKTPFSRDRGARRIVVGHVGEYYYTSDHYRTFQRITGLPP